MSDTNTAGHAVTSASKEREKLRISIYRFKHRKRQVGRKLISQ